MTMMTTIIRGNNNKANSFSPQASCHDAYFTIVLTNPAISFFFVVPLPLAGPHREVVVVVVFRNAYYVNVVPVVGYSVCLLMPSLSLSEMKITKKNSPKSHPFHARMHVRCS